MVQNHDVPLEATEEALADASAELELSEGISSNVVERFRRFEKEVSVLALWRYVLMIQHNVLVKEVKEQEEDLQKVTQSLSSILVSSAN